LHVGCGGWQRRSYYLFLDLNGDGIGPHLSGGGAVGGQQANE
jgi:hypothetical protein